jgi:two-component system response regulator DesR
VTSDSASAQRPLRLLVVDDHDVVQWGFRLMLERQRWIERCAGARTGPEAYAVAAKLQPDVAVIDLFVGGEEGTEICARLRERHPNLKVLLISGAGRIQARQAQACGALGFVSKDWPAPDVLRAVRMVSLGMTVFKAPAEGPGDRLSEREREVLELIAGGSTNREIAAALHLSPHTVKGHTSSLYRKLSARNRAEAVQRAQRLGLAADPPVGRF